MMIMMKNQVDNQALGCRLKIGRTWQRLVANKILSLCVWSLLVVCLQIKPASGQFGGGAGVKPESYIAVEIHSGKVMYSLGADQQRPIGGLTNVATAIVVVDWANFAKRSLSEMAVVPQQAAMLPGPNPMGLQAGEQASLRDLLYSTLLGGDPVAAQTLAYHVGTAIQIERGGGRDANETFVSEMNRLARYLGMTRTRYIDPHGLELRGGRGSLSTAVDQVRLAMHAHENEALMFLVRQAERTVKVRGLGGERSYKIKNANQMVGQMGVSGIKAATSGASGACLLATAEKANLVRKDGAGQTLVTPRALALVVLGSTDRYTRARSLITNSWAQFDGWARQGFPLTGEKGERVVLAPRP